MLFYNIETDSTTTGANVTLATPEKTVLRITGAITSIDTITAPSSAQYFILRNETGNAVTITQSGNIVTGVNDSIDIEDSASVSVLYDTVESKWVLVGGSGGGSSNAIDVVYDNNSSSLLATNVQAAIDEIDGTLSTALQPSDILDEDNFATDSSAKAPSQASVKKYVDNSQDNLFYGDNNNFEVTIGDYVLFDDESCSIVDGVGGSPYGLTASNSGSSTALNGLNSLYLTWSNLEYGPPAFLSTDTGCGEGVSVDFILPKKFLGLPTKELVICFNYQTTGDTAAERFNVAVIQVDDLAVVLNAEIATTDKRDRTCFNFNGQTNDAKDDYRLAFFVNTTDPVGVDLNLILDDILIRRKEAVNALARVAIFEKTTNQNFSSGAFTDLIYQSNVQTESFVTKGVDNKTFTINESGRYKITYDIAFAQTTNFLTALNNQITVLKNPGGFVVGSSLDVFSFDTGSMKKVSQLNGVAQGSFIVGETFILRAYTQTTPAETQSNSAGGQKIIIEKID